MSAVLVVAATPMETAWMRAQSHPPDLELSFLHTGVSMMAAAYALGTWQAQHSADFALQVGIAGAYDPDLDLGSVVEAVEEILAEVGADAPEGFLDLEGLGFPLLTVDGREMYNLIDNPHPCFPALRAVRGITVNTVQGTSEGIAQMTARWHPEIESMEGAAFFFAMRKKNIPFAQIRGISNRVEPRNRANWKLQEAAMACQQVAWDFLSNRFFNKNISPTSPPNPA